MVSGGRRAAGTVSRALDSLLGHITGHARGDVADPYLLRISVRSWGDIGDSPPRAEPPVEAAKRHRIVRKFYDQFSEPARVDSGVPIDAVSDRKVFRIKAGDWRAAVRYMPEDGIKWMCRALSLADFNDEQHAYVEFGNFHRRNVLLPDIAERRLATGDQFVVSAVLALRRARVDADNEPDRWWPADAARPDGSSHRVGRIYVERELVEDEGEYVTRFVLLITAPPGDVEIRTHWREFIAAHIFPTDEPVQPTYELPAGTNLRTGEMPFMQQTVEVLDEDTEADDQ
jgi:hypothetical protein